MPYHLTNEPAHVRHKSKPPPPKQGVLLSGLDCLPDQGDLFDTDGAGRLPDRETPNQKKTDDD